LLAFQPWRRRLARRRPRTGRQRGGGGRREVGRRRFDLHPAGSRGGIYRRLPVHPEYPTGGSIGGAQSGRQVVAFTLLRCTAPGIRRSQLYGVRWCRASLGCGQRCFKGRWFGRPHNVDGHITARFNLVACNHLHAWSLGGEQSLTCPRRYRRRSNTHASADWSANETRGCPDCQAVSNRFLEPLLSIVATTSTSLRSSILSISASLT